MLYSRQTHGDVVMMADDCCRWWFGSEIQG